mgnify:FL=1
MTKKTFLDFYASERLRSFSFVRFLDNPGPKYCFPLKDTAFRVLDSQIIPRTLHAIPSYFVGVSQKTCCFLEGAPDSAQQQARRCCAVFILEMELHMQFILNQDGELIITDEAEEAFDLDETDE